MKKPNLYAVFYNTSGAHYIETTRKRGFFMEAWELVRRSLHHGRGRTIK